MRGCVPLLLLGLGWSAAAYAEGYSADIELLRPTFAAGGVPGIDDVRATDHRAIRLGLITQYERNPLIMLGRDGSRLGSVVGNRMAFDLGASIDVSRRLTLRTTIPLAAQFSSTVDEFSADGFGARDVGFGATFRLTRQVSVLHLGLRADLTAPIGQKLAWLGEDTLRAGGGLVLSGEGGPLVWSADLGVLSRQLVVTKNGLSVGTEGYYGASLQYRLIRDRLSVSAGSFGRVGFHDAFGDGETGFEVIGGAKLQISRKDSIDLVAGKGFANGYGTTDLRIALGYTWTTPIGRPPVIEDEPERDIELPDPDQAVVDRIPKATIVVEPDIVPDPPPKPPEPLAKLVNSRIEVRDPIKFYVGTNRVLPESIPTLWAVAALIKPGDLLVIEGRASVEGQYKYNYDLSVSRAQIVYEELVRTGVSPNNLAWRALGEVSPIIDGTDEKQLAESRRVSFYVIPLPGGPPPAAPEVTLPWDGTTVPNRLPQEKP